MPYSTEEQRVADWIRGSLPKWFTSTPRAEEDIGALVKLYDAVRAQVAFWRDQAAIPTAVGPVVGEGGLAEPDWLGQHAKDRGTSRQEGETDEALRERLRRYEDAVTKAALLTLINQMLDADGVTSNAYGLVELRRDRAYLCTRQRITGTGDSFTKVGSVMTLTDDAASFVGGMVRWDRGGAVPSITIAGATSGGNNGTFPITGFVGDTGVTYVNASGVAEAFAGTWTINSALHDRQDSYIGRGYRVGGRRAKMIAILPYPSTEALRLAVLEAIRQRKAAGVASVVEARANP